ncbi:hypothetical protein [Lacrimispora sp. 210928-DFI.3.58]|uniref:hypothetical protein n=1 Tax=Lacrimispora sp. 210928-DFI.3.58 TaxID=2883214 RepID=UPI001D0608E1|nr:hypothetical protein [Lacrimispora sp. 210928-DFI.3.58]
MVCIAHNWLPPYIWIEDLRACILALLKSNFGAKLLKKAQTYRFTRNLSLIGEKGTQRISKRNVNKNLHKAEGKWLKKGKKERL